MAPNSSFARIWQNPSDFPPEAVLRELENLLRSNPDFWLKINRDGFIVDYKTSRFVNIGDKPETLLGKHIDVGLPPYLREITAEALAYLSEKKSQVFWKEYSYGIEPNIRYVEVRFVVLYEGYIMSNHRDITERKRLENAFLESESRFLSMAQNAADSIIIINDEGIIQFFNKTAENTFGYTHDEVIGKNVTMIIPGEYKEKHDEYLRRYKATGTQHIIGVGRELVALRKSGEIFPCELSVGEFKTKSGKMFTGILRDISQRKIQEQELYQYRNHLEELVESQTMDLKMSKNIAEEASYMKSLFLANISHELKTPIHAILSYAELGEEKSATVTPEKIKEYFQIIDSSGKRLLGLLENLLDIAKLESGKMRYLFEKNCLKETAKFVINEMRVILEKRGITVVLLDKEERWEAEFDYERIQQVIRNILSNALKFIPNDTNIEISMVRREFIPRKTQSYVNGIGIQIRDFGPGIPPEDLDKIFEKFIQSKQVKAGTKGTGLGLSISREIVNDHHGLLYAENHETKGAIFTMLIPCSREELR
ncbi:PAS domain S-box protein [Leptospira meyeri]|uniref:sensor histidine kinase n=1 Tax=Leptospira meyeri TaxID=29508 RepID=UPI0002BD4E3F|nr:PAS domain S-box protein [Leptospira meyeri]PKA24738.1 PAS domain-containing sensor histidine kinase [Leptospira sp. mixed culture ATI2-C-A1]EMJ88188.1 PAS domain S-box protein [Leptospira meyeri serovar Semaranga str. Veldrot Semarang 173]PKA13576.1 PAS domain-containing sensor histidine kinase [Leptospira meyeri]TGL15066.1 PAS domain S-box protein [Leptospira meyeri]TGM19467.1 PAS domain S-box protein [Leptospira meyeri]